MIETALSSFQCFLHLIGQDRHVKFVTVTVLVEMGSSHSCRGLRMRLWAPRYKKDI